VTERSETPEGEPEADETAITEPVMADEPAPLAEPVPPAESAPVPEPPALAPPTPPPPPVVPPAPAYNGGGSPAAPASRPELQIGAAFAGGFVLALILKRLAR
jgi:hypothetical protein